MGLSWVTAIELDEDDTLTLHVRVDGFEPNIPVEISGYVTQSNGAVATFHSIQSMPSTAGAAADMDVIDVQAAEGAGFSPVLPFTVVARAADVWITKLTKDDNLARAANVPVAWSSPQNGYHTALVPNTAASQAADPTSAWQPSRAPG
jgi:hypothetical protein